MSTTQSRSECTLSPTGAGTRCCSRAAPSRPPVLSCPAEAPEHVPAGGLQPMPGAHPARTPRRPRPLPGRGADGRALGTARVTPLPPGDPAGRPQHPCRCRQKAESRERYAPRRKHPPAHRAAALALRSLDRPEPPRHRRSRRGPPARPVPSRPGAQPSPAARAAAAAPGLPVVPRISFLRCVWGCSV